MYGWIFSMFFFMYSGNCFARFSRFDRCLEFSLFTACFIHLLIGCDLGYVSIRVAVLRILLCRRHLGGGFPVSASSAEVDVVLKHPVIAIVARRCTMASFWVCSVVGALL